MKQKVGPTSEREARWSTYFVLETLQWMDSRVPARHEQMTASRIRAPRLHVTILPITGIKRRSTAARYHKPESRPDGTCCLCMSPGARRGLIPEWGPSKLRVFLLHLDENVHIVRNWLENHSRDEIHVWKTETVWSISAISWLTGPPIQPSHAWGRAGWLAHFHPPPSSSSPSFSSSSSSSSSSSTVTFFNLLFLYNISYAVFFYRVMDPHLSS